MNGLVLLVLILNAIAAGAGAVLALFAAIRPGVLSRDQPITPGQRFYARMYAGKGVPFGILAALLPFMAPGPGTGIVLALAAASQLVDAGLGLRRRELPQVIGSVVAAGLHVATGVLIW